MSLRHYEGKDCIRLGRGDLSVLRVGVGIGRPESREKGAVANYVLAPVSEAELKAYSAAAEGVVKVILEEGEM